jgi:hypothetical protein
MAFQYSRILSDYVPVFPGGIYVPVEARNADDNGYAVTAEPFVVPSVVDGDGKRRINLGHVPLEQPAFELLIGVSPRDVVPWGETPAAGQVAVQWETGAVEFHASDSGQAGTTTYTGCGTAAQAFFMHALQKEIAAMQAVLLAGGAFVSVPWRMTGMTTVPSSSAGGILRIHNPATEGTWRVASFSMWSERVPGGSTASTYRLAAAYSGIAPANRWDLTVAGAAKSGKTVTGTGDPLTVAHDGYLELWPAAADTSAAHEEPQGVIGLVRTT